uniref:Suppressor of white apricot N-terminal domain-containing protein n=1 Tax=Buteo japonicus TaxID=224669 RepID=A0A8C0AVJ3_9AVES
MWHEARKHERKLRGMMVDYKKRAERRREYYEKIKKDPAQFLQVHGRACKVHLDSAVALAAESPVNMMPWQGDTNNMIDRFDVRAHLDYIPMYTPPLLNPISPEQESDERKCNYERYRGLVQNDFAGISEEQCLYQIYIDELYGGLQKPNEDEKKKLAEKKASIGYTYEDSTVAELENSLEKRGDEEDSEEDSNTDEDEVIPDIDVEVDVDELNQEQVADLNKQATTYGMADGDFVRYGWRLGRTGKALGTQWSLTRASPSHRRLNPLRTCLSLGWGAPKKSPLRTVVASGLLLRVSLFWGGEKDVAEGQRRGRSY